MCPPGRASARDRNVEEISKRLLDVMRLVGSVAAKPDDSLTLMNDSGLTVPQLLTLQLLRLAGAHTVSEIADKTALSRPATSHLVERLVEMGLVVRAEDANDRRQKQVSLSEKGTAVIDRLSQARRSHVAQAIESLTPGTRGRLAEALEEVQRELEERRAAKEAGR